jgi:hypothetical protein
VLPHQTEDQHTNPSFRWNTHCFECLFSSSNDQNYGTKKRFDFFSN